MSWEKVICGKLCDVAGTKVIFDGGTWIQETYIQGDYPEIGKTITGNTGIETVQRQILTGCLVDPAFKVNGKSVATLQHLVAPEFQHLIQATQFSPALELIPGQEIILPQEERQAA